MQTTATERIGRYDLVAHLATGGMGQVFLARSSGLGGFVRHVVLKTLDLPGTDEDEAIAMFLDEARLLGLLHHQHIAPIYAVEKDDDGQLFLVMDYIHGKTAHDAWTRTIELGAALPIDFSLTIAAAAASGLHYAHTRRDAEGRTLRIVHRDVSLSNLMIGYDGAVKLIDFGIAKAANQSTQTQAGFIKGKLGYMAPEQLRGLAVDARTDVFALGIVLYELTTMRRAFRDESDRVTMDRIRAGTFTPPSELNPEYPPELERIVTRALRVDPRERYPDAEAMRRDIDLLGHQLGLVLGDAAIIEVLSQLFDQRHEPWQRATTARPPSELEVPLEIVPPAPPEDDSRATLPVITLRAATAAAESQMVTPPHGIPKRPSAFSITGAKPAVGNDTDGVTIVPADPAAAAAVSAAVGSDTEALPALAGDTDALPARPSNRASRAPIEPPEAAASRVMRAMKAARAQRLTQSRKPRPRWIRVAGWIAGALLAAAAVSGAVYLLEGSGSAPAEANAPDGSGAQGAATPPPSSPSPSPSPPRPASGAPARPVPPALLAPGAELQIVVKSTPPDATVLLDGRRLGRTPFTGTIEAAAGPHALRLRKKGYLPVSLDIELTADVTREVTLRRDPAATSSP